MEDSNSNREQKAGRKEEVIALYQDLDQFLESEEFEEEIKKVLAISNPNYLQILKKRKRDIERQDHGIVLAGETSSGKSTLVNKILEKKILITRNAQSTSTVCKIRNSEKIKISAKHASGQTKEIDLTDECDINNTEGEKLLRDTLKTFTDLGSSEESKEYQSVDIGLPIPFLKGGAILVDTPGIGGSEELTKKMMEYIPNALSFVFVLSVTSACITSKDRLPHILKELICLKIEEEMPCFDPEDVIFITNKWDSINQDDSDSEDEEKRTWEQILFDIKSIWPQVTEKNIFKMSLKEVSPGKMNSSVEQFKEFRKVLMSNIEKTENARVIVHLRFLEELLTNVTKNIQARLQLDKKSEEEQNALTAKHQEEIESLKGRCNKVKEDLQKRVTVHIDKSAKRLERQMSTELLKTKILNPVGYKPIMDAIDNPDDCAKEVQRRFNLHIEFYLKSDEVEEGFEAMNKDLELFFKDISSKVQVLENEWIAHTDKDEQTKRETTSESMFAFGLLSLSFPVLAVLGLGIGIVDSALAPIRAAREWFFNTKERKKTNIDKEYERCRSSVYKTVHDQLERQIGSVLRKLIDRVTASELPRQIGALEEMIQQLSRSRQKIISNRNLLLNLASKIGVMQNQIRKI